MKKIIKLVILIFASIAHAMDNQSIQYGVPMEDVAAAPRAGQKHKADGPAEGEQRDAKRQKTDHIGAANNGGAQAMAEEPMQRPADVQELEKQFDSFRGADEEKFAGIIDFLKAHPEFLHRDDFSECGTPLWLAIRAGYLETVKQLIALGADLARSKGRNLSCYALGQTNVATLEWLWHNYPSWQKEIVSDDVMDCAAWPSDFCDDDGYEPKCDCSLIRWLIEHGASPNNVLSGVVINAAEDEVDELREFLPWFIQKYPASLEDKELEDTGQDIRNYTVLERVIQEMEDTGYFGILRWPNVKLLIDLGANISRVVEKIITYAVKARDITYLKKLWFEHPVIKAHVESDTSVIGLQLRTILVKEAFECLLLRASWSNDDINQDQEMMLFALSQANESGLFSAIHSLMTHITKCYQLSLSEGYRNNYYARYGRDLLRILTLHALDHHLAWAVAQHDQARRIDELWYKKHPHDMTYKSLSREMGEWETEYYASKADDIHIAKNINADESLLPLPTDMRRLVGEYLGAVFPSSQPNAALAVAAAVAYVASNSAERKN